MASSDTVKCDLGGDDRPSQLQQVAAPGQPPAKRQAMGHAQTKPSKSQEQQAHDQAYAQAQAADANVWGPVGGPVPRCRNGCGALRFVCGETCDGKPATPSDTEEEDSDNCEDEDEDEDGQNVTMDAVNARSSDGHVSNSWKRAHAFARLKCTEHGLPACLGDRERPWVHMQKMNEDVRTPVKSYIVNFPDTTLVCSIRGPDHGCRQVTRCPRHRRQRLLHGSNT